MDLSSSAYNVITSGLLPDNTLRHSAQQKQGFRYASQKSVHAKACANVRLPSPRVPVIR